MKRLLSGLLRRLAYCVPALLLGLGLLLTIGLIAYAEAPPVRAFAAELILRYDLAEPAHFRAQSEQFLAALTPTGHVTKTGWYLLAGGLALSALMIVSGIKLRGRHG